MNDFDEIKAAALKVMTGYQKDLEIDAAEIASYLPDEERYALAPGWEPLCRQQHHDLRPSCPGEVQVRYLFGSIDRDGMVRAAVGMAQYYKNPFHGPCLLVHYFDGSKVRKITVDKAAQIGVEWAAKIQRQFDREKAYA